jgi:hypothetical protein
VLCWREPGVVVGTAADNLAVLGHVLTRGAEGTVDSPEATVKHGLHPVLSELTNSAMSCRHSGEFALRNAIVRLMRSASAMSVTCAGRKCFRSSRKAAFAAELGDWGWLRFSG